MGSARRFFLLGSTGTYRHGPFVVCLSVLSPALCSFSWGSVSEAETEKAVHTKRQARDPQPPASLQGPSSLGRILSCHGDLGPPRASLIVSEFTQAWSTIRQDGFLSCGIMRPGCPEGIWQSPRGGLSLRVYYCHGVTRACLSRTGELSCPGEHFSLRIVPEQPCLSLGKRRVKNKAPICPRCFFS